MLGASVPEATVDKDRYAASREYQVGFEARAIRKGSEIYPVPEPGGMRQSPHCELRCCVSAGVAPHHRPNGRS